MPPMTFNGVVTKAGVMNKTVTVTVSRFVNHKLTGKRLLRSKKFLVHDEANQLKVEDEVVIRNCRPLSALKRFTLQQLVKSPAAEREAARAERLKAASSSSSSSTSASSSSTSSPVLDAIRTRQKQQQKQQVQLQN